MRKNLEWDIEVAIPLPEKEGWRKEEVVIGNRHTDFQPYVAWLCFEEKDYAYGDYCQTYEEALKCAMDKLDREMQFYGRDE